MNTNSQHSPLILDPLEPGDLIHCWAVVAKFQFTVSPLQATDAPRYTHSRPQIQPEDGGKNMVNLESTGQALGPYTPQPLGSQTKPQIPLQPQFSASRWALLGPTKSLPFSVM